jgi:hypothetical protein
VSRGRPAARLSCSLCLLALVAVALPAAGGAAAPPTSTFPCGRGETRSALRGFAAAFDGGDFARLDRLFAPEPAFQWYSSGRPGRRLGAAAKRRDTLVAYFRRRHGAGDRFRILSFHWNGRSRHWSNFAFDLRRRIPHRGGFAWAEVPGKGAAICEGVVPRLIVLTLGDAKL